MAVILHKTTFRRLADLELKAWKDADTASVSDCLGRFMSMDGGIQSLDSTLSLLGQARTVRCMVGDNSALHVALDIAEPGDVLVVDGEGFVGHALWGGLMTQAAKLKGLAGIVIDGAVRDSRQIAESGFPCFARGRVPAGPHKNFGGSVDGPIACGGVAINAGDLVVGDADGVVVVPLAQVEKTHAA
ncbi:MAG: RraA family protein, partial [Myxococcota bacterium]